MEDLNRAKNRIEQLCQAGNIKISSVASDLFGLSGRTMLKAIVEGRRDAGWMADYARGALRGKRRELELALDGSFTDNQRWLLHQELGQVEWLDVHIQVLDQEIARRMTPFEEQMRRLTTIPGIEYKTAWTIVAEIGVDMSAFEDVPHLASWAGLCPGNRESGGKRMSGRMRKANRYIKRALCQAAWAAAHTRNTYPAAFYRRLQARKGPQKAVMALAHHLLAIVYNVLKRREEYVEIGGDFYDRRNKSKTVSRMVARLAKLGYQVALTPTEPEEPVAAACETETEQPVDSISEFRAELTGQEAFQSPPRTELYAEIRANLLPVNDAVTPKRKRGRPCKCAERGIPCKHQVGLRLNSFETQGLDRGEFS